MKIAFLGDRHLSAKQDQYQEAVDLWRWAVDDAAQRSPHLYIGLGDVCEGWPSSGREISTLATMYRKMWTGIRPIEVLGNHEAIDALDWLDAAGLATIVTSTFRLLHYPGLAVLLIPYPRRGSPPFDNLVAKDIRGSMQEAAERIRQWVDAARGQYPSDRLIVAGHFTVGTMRVGASDFEIHAGTEVVVPPEYLKAADLVLVAHIHKAQAFDNIVGVGAIRRCSKAEIAEEKSYVITSLHDGELSWERYPIPTPPMLDLKIRWSDLATFQWPDVKDADVYIEVMVDEAQVATYDQHVLEDSLYSMGARRWHIERNTPRAVRTRSERIASANTLEEEFDAWLAATNQIVGSDRRLLLSDALRQIS